MPRKPRFSHPVRQVRTCLGHSQQSFAKLVGCSSITVQRIENGNLKLSKKLAYKISEATAANARSLLSRGSASAMDMGGEPYSKASLEFLKNVLPITEDELRFYLHKLVNYLELLLIASNRAGKFKTYGVNAAVQESFSKIAEDFSLEESIRQFLIEQRSVTKRIYRVCDLRKYPEFARLIGYQDNRKFSPKKLVAFEIPKGWMKHYTLHEIPILPHGADHKLNPNAKYILDEERPIPPEIKEAIDQALFWEIKDFQLTAA